MPYDITSVALFSAVRLVVEPGEPLIYFTKKVSSVVDSAPFLVNFVLYNVSPVDRGSGIPVV